MTPRDEASPSSAVPRKRPYTPPKLEKLGTLRQVVLGPGSNNFFDGGHPPGQNKSRIA